MALKTIMLKHKIDKLRSDLAALQAKDADFETREAELEAAIDEAQTEEEQTTVEDLVDKYDKEKKEHDEAKEALSAEIEDLERDLEEAEAHEPQERGGITPVKKEKEERNTMTTIDIRSLPLRRRAFDALPIEERKSIVAQAEVKDFLARVRAMKGQQRGVTGAELSIPITFLELISENMYRYSKLLNRVRVRSVNGETRQTIAGTIPEAVWTEMCGALNELNFQFNQITLDGYKVAGFVPICNSILEDNDINLSAWIIEALSEAIGKAIDKAILYGKGGTYHMPLGIVTRLAQSAAPDNYPASAPAWEDLHESNIIKITETGTGAAFWAALMAATGATYTPYSRGTQFWAMNSKTYAQLKSKLITFTGTGDIVSNIFGTLPIINGDIDILEFMPDGDIVGGYGDLYLFVDRAGMTIESDSSGIFFIQDNTVFRGKQRADGAPVIPGAFVAININNAAVTTAMDFAADTANDAQLSALAIGSESLSPTFAATTYAYTLTAAGTSAKIEATSAQPGAEIEVNYNGSNVRNGGTVTWLADSTAHPLTVTVRKGNAVRVYTIQVTKAAS